MQKQYEFSRGNAKCCNGFGFFFEKILTCLVTALESSDLRAFSKVSFLLISAQREGISTPLTTIGELLSSCITEGRLLFMLVVKGVGTDNGIACGAVALIALKMEWNFCLLE